MPTFPHVQRYFDPACIQLDFGAAQAIDARPSLVEEGGGLNAAANAVFEASFSNRERPGWFCSSQIQRAS